MIMQDSGREGNPRQYSFWFAASIQERAFVTSMARSTMTAASKSPTTNNLLNPLITKLLSKMMVNFETIKSTNFDAIKGLYFNTDNRDGMEFSVGGGSGASKQGFRPTLNSYMIGEARALAKFWQMRGMLGKSDDLLNFANTLKANMDLYLWDNVTQFYKVLPRKPQQGVMPTLVDVKELIGYTPWYFNIPDTSKAVAWSELRSEQGFKAPFGLTTCEQRHPKFSVRYDKTHECQWNGPVWPYATSMTLTSLIKYLQGQILQGTGTTPYVTQEDFLQQLRTYAKSHFRIRSELDNKTVSWIDENQHPYTGIVPL
jgi:hypothetical protein